jgi:hypothetical protein
MCLDSSVIRRIHFEHFSTTGVSLTSRLVCIQVLRHRGYRLKQETNFFGFKYTRQPRTTFSFIFYLSKIHQLFCSRDLGTW